MSNIDKSIKLPRAETPELAGVHSSVITSFMKACDNEKLNMHSMLVIKDGKVAAECSWAPFRSEIPHTMFSFSKGITSIAIGFAVSEGLISLEDKVSKYFPSKQKTQKAQEYADSITIRHLITHRSGKKISITNNCEKNDWLDTWLNAPFGEKPGEKFNYTSENIYILSRIISKVSGQTMTEFLTPRLYEPLGMETPYWEKDHNGYDAGGWGAYFTPEDMGKIGLCYLNKGMYNGKQVIPEKWIKLSTTRHIEKIPSIFNKDSGYGYQIFIQSHEMGTFSFNGLYGQFVVVFPKYNAVFVCTAGEPREDTFMKILWNHFPAAFEIGDEPIAPADNDYKEMKSYMDKLASRRPPLAKRKPEMEKIINDRLIKVDIKGTAGILGTGNLFMLSRRSGSINNFKFRFDKDSATVEFQEKNSPLSVIEVGLDGNYRFSTIKLSDLEMEVASYATWISDNKLRLVIMPLPMAQYRVFTLTFSDNGNVKIHSEAKPGFPDLLEFYLMFNGTRPGAVLKKLIGLVSVGASLVLDPNIKGKLQ